MNERIAALAREAGLSITDFYDTKLCAGRPEHIEALVKLVAKDCADLCDNTDILPGKDFARIIRERYGL